MNYYCLLGSGCLADCVVRVTSTGCIAGLELTSDEDRTRGGPARPAPAKDETAEAGKKQRRVGQLSAGTTWPWFSPSHLGSYSAHMFLVDREHLKASATLCPR
jgi:hypothetical protein